jgi:hypothetical protein
MRVAIDASEIQPLDASEFPAIQLISPKRQSNDDVRSLLEEKNITHLYSPWELMRTSAETRATLQTSQNLEALLKASTPIVFSGASRDSWPKISPDQQVRIENELEQFFESIKGRDDFIIITGGTDFGVEKIVHRICKEKGIPTFGSFVAEVKEEGIVEDTVSNGFIAGNSWYDKGAMVTELVRDYDGVIFFVGGGNIIKDEIQAAYNSGASFYLMEGPEGAAQDKLGLYPDNKFNNYRDMVDKLNQKQDRL